MTSRLISAPARLNKLHFVGGVNGNDMRIKASDHKGYAIRPGSVRARRISINARITGHDAMLMFKMK